MKSSTAFILLLAFVLLEDCRVKGRCGNDDNVANTRWAACLVAEDDVRDGNCPHGFLKLDVPCPPVASSRSRNGVRIPWKNLVCCVINPIYDLKIKETPCMANSPSNDKEQKKSHRHHST